MKQNKYDAPEFFDIYSKMPRSAGGLAQAEEWPLLRALLPDLEHKNFLDLGCGYGWHCRYAAEQKAARVVGVDISQKMLARARELTPPIAPIEYRCCAIEDIDFPENEFDVVFSSLALHYVRDYNEVCRKVHRCLRLGGSFVLSVEHPIFTALPAQDWHYGPDGTPLHWPVDNYQSEGIRHTQWLAEDVVKYHRTLETYINSLIQTGFRLSSVLEPKPSDETLARRPELKDECRRPIFLLIATVRNE
jgi:SAM-dependent methyltransferase